MAAESGWSRADLARDDRRGPRPRRWPSRPPSPAPSWSGLRRRRHRAQVCAELAGTGIPVGVIPAGTGNLLARNLDIPLYLRSAVDVALNGQDRAIDLVNIAGDGIARTSHFMVMAGMGFDAAIMEGANEQIKAKVGWIAYVVSGCAT